MKRVVYLAAGHGGGDPGAIGQGTTEAAETIQIVNRTADKLRADGQIEVVVVPHELGLIDEINWVNARVKNLEDALAIEVHKNSTENAHGIETWYWGNDSGSQGLAQKLQDGMMRATGLPVSRGIKGDNTNRWGSLGWIRETNPWALLVEMGFVSNGGDPVDDAADDRYAEGLLLGILNANGLAKKVVQAPIPTPPPVAAVSWRVFAGEKQIGAYTVEANAWNKYAAENGTKILDKDGNDVTAQFVIKYRPITVPPVESPSHPEYDPAKDKEQDDRLNAIESILQAIVNWIKSFGK